MTGLNEYTVLFHSINGSNIKEKYTNFNHFLELLKSNLNDDEDLKYFATSIVPKTALEEIFRIEIIILSNNKKLLLDELKTCNVVFVKKLLKNWKLFEELFSDINSTDLVNNILPYLSYSLKLKILNGICKNVKNEELVDEYFKVIEQKYGLQIAAVILPACSMNLIRCKIEKFHLKLSQTHLKMIFKKDKLFVEFYFDVLKKKYENIDFTNNYLSMLKYLAKVDPNIYWKLHDKYNLTVKFGKSMTPNMVKTHKKIVENGRSALDIFHHLKLFRTTKKEGTLNSLLLSFFPEVHDKFKDEFLTYNILRFIQKGPVSQQYHLVSSFFNEKYKRNLMDYPDYFTEDLLKIMPIEERESVLDCKVMDNEEMLYLYRTSTSISNLKKQLQHSSNSKTRSKIGLHLYKACAANKDEIALLDVLLYICNKHKNDIDLLYAFLNQLIGWPNIKKLSTEHWQYIVNIKRILEKTPSRYWMSTEFDEYYMYHLIDNKKPIHDIVKKHVQDMVEGCKYAFVYISDENYYKEYCDEIAICLDSYKEHDKYKMLCKHFIAYVQCKLYSKKVEIFDYARFLDQLDDNDPFYFKACCKLELIHEDRIHEKYWKSNTTACNHLVLWYAKHRPDLLQKNVQKLSTFVNISNIQIFTQKLKKICEPDILKEFEDQALHYIQSENYSKAIFPIRLVSVLSPNYFSELIIPLLPASDGKIDLEKNITEKVNLQKEIAKGLSNVGKDPSKLFPLILKFCIGDYLKFGLQPLYKSVYNMPEFQTKNYLSKLTDSTVSVKKHVVYLSKDVYESDDFYDLLKDWSQKETNLSMRNILLKKSIEHLIKNPSERIWSLLISNFNTIDTNDREMYDFLSKFEKIPLDYLPKYLELIYEALSNNSDSIINEKRFNLINKLPTGIITKLDEKLLKHIITDEEILFGEIRVNFNWKCIFHANKDIQLLLFEASLATLKQYVVANNFNLKQDARIQSKISFFLYRFVYLAVQLKQGLHFVQRFISIWPSIFHPETLCKDYMLIRFTDLYFKCGFDAYQIGLKTNELLYEYISKYNNSVIEIFCNEMRDFLTMAGITKNEDMFKFVEGIFHEKKDQSIYIAIMYFLPKTLPEIDNMYAKYIPIIRAIEECDSPSVQYHFDEYLTEDYEIPESSDLFGLFD